MAVSAFYTNRYGKFTNMERQCNRHDAHPLYRSVANRLSVMAMLFPAPNGVVFILSEKSKNVNSGVALDFSPLRGIMSMKRALPISG